MIASLAQIILVVPLLTGFVIYFIFVIRSNHRYKQWAFSRTICWTLGILCAAFAVAGPLAQRSHTDFALHMVSHLLLGMAAPILIVLAAPITLVLRTISVQHARRLIRIIKSLPFRILSDPFVASLLNIGGVWILYTTDLYANIHESIFLHIFIHLHVFLAGYLFTLSIITIDPNPHRSSFVYRAIVLVFAIAGHGILSKYIYVNPPTGVSVSQAEVGGILMYYGGDAIDIVLIFIFCLQWYKKKRPKANFIDEYA